MSIKVMSAIWDNSQHGGSKLLVLLALADWADDQGGNIFPSVHTIAKKVRLEDRQVQYILNELEESGDITIREKGHVNTNGQATNLYTLKIPKEVQSNAPFKRQRRGKRSKGVQSNAPQGVQSNAPQGVQSNAPNPSVDPSSDPLDIFPEAGGDKPAESEVKTPDQEPLPFKAPAANEVSAPKEKIASGASEHKCSSNYQPLFSALATLTGLNVRLKASLIGRAARDLDSIGATAADVEKVRDWWYANDWRGLRRQAPTLEQVKEAWDRALNPGLVPEPVPVPLRNNGGSYMPGKVMTPAAIRNRSMGFDV